MPVDLGGPGLQGTSEATLDRHGLVTKALEKALLVRAIMDTDRA
jgi:hypothetical protein